MKSAFAKLFGTDGKQVLVKMDVDDDGNPEIRFYFQPHDDLGICSYAIGWKDDSDESFGKCEATFDEITEESALGSVKALVEKMNLEQALEDREATP